jgi:hypothetical protein
MHEVTKSTGKSGPHGPTQTSQLAELVACERELADLLAAAEAEGRAMVEEARASATAAEADIEAALEGEGERARADIREATQRKVRAIQVSAQELVARFERVSDEEAGRLADIAFRLLVGPEAET